MGRALLFGAVMGAILLVAATTRSDVVPSDVGVDEATSLPEHITGTPAVTPPSTDPPPKDPFAPFDVGPTESIWPYDSLTVEERAVVDRGRDTTGWQLTHSEYATAVRDRSREARAATAQHALGIDSSFEYAGVLR